MEKLAGGWPLSCGHRQHLSQMRVGLAAVAVPQQSVYCVECGDWSRVILRAVEAAEGKESANKEIE